jgi:TetR/AcrR family transcriptional repressor of nem operon
MRYSKEHKEETRKKIVEAASRLFREKGYDGVGVDAIMSEVGLTAGGFYAHFPSKEALFSESIAKVMQSRSNLLQATPKSEAMQKEPKSAGEPEWLKNLIFSYLSRTHREMLADGCPLPTLTTDVIRGSKETRSNYEKQVIKFFERIQKRMPQGETPERERAMAVLAQCVGGLMLARAVTDEKLSNQILKACRQAAMKVCQE